MDRQFVNRIRNLCRRAQKQSQSPNARWSVPEFNRDGERRCLMCGQSYPCICSDEDDKLYTAHCMDCNWSLSRDGYMGGFVAPSPEEALRLWNLLNDRKTLPQAIAEIAILQEKCR